MDQGYAVVDFETTGLSPAKGDRAIEIGLVHVSPDGTLEDEHETLIHVDRSVGASWVHHITARELLHAPDFEGIAHELRDLLAGIANEDAHSALSDAHATAILLGRLIESDPEWPGFNRRLESAVDAADRWPTFSSLPKKEWLPRNTHADGNAVTR